MKRCRHCLEQVDHGGYDYYLNREVYYHVSGVDEAVDKGNDNYCECMLARYGADASAWALPGPEDIYEAKE